MKRIIWVLILIITALLLGCTSNKSDDVKPSEVIVFAAASMTESLNELAKGFETAERDIKVTFNFAGSQVLKTSIENSTKADIFISASTNYMDDLNKRGYVKDYKLFLKNRIVLASGNKSKVDIKSLKDLTAEGAKIAVGDKSVPVGKYWEEAFGEALKDGTLSEDDKTKIENNIKTRELNVKDVVSKILLNEVDAGVVYKTDITQANADKIKIINIPIFEKFDASYPLAILKGSEDSEAVKKFYDYLLSDKAKKIFKKYGFIVD